MPSTDLSGKETNLGATATIDRDARTRVLVADDHEVIRQGLRALLEEENDYEVCGEAANGWEAVEKARRLRPDVVVLDVSMPGLNGLEAARQIRGARLETEIMVLTGYDSEQLAQKLLAAGVHGYLLKSDLPSDLLAGINSLRQHRPFFSTKITTMVLNGYVSTLTDESSLDASLTARERQIIQLLAEGKSNKEVANSLGISVKTAETHRARLMQKLNLHSIADVVHYAVRNRIIEP